MIELTDWLRAELRARADTAAPEEACGLISRKPSGLIALWACENAAQDPEHSFEIAANDLLSRINKIRARGETLAGVYHSHSGAPAPSPFDLEAASRWPGLTWIIVGQRICSRRPEDLAADCEPECPKCKGKGMVPAFWSGVLA